MGASKTQQYTIEEIQNAVTANALGHPARIRIMSLIQHGKSTRNTDLTKVLELSKSTVNAHLIKLHRASLIDIEFGRNCYLIRPNMKIINKISANFLIQG